MQRFKFLIRLVLCAMLSLFATLALGVALSGISASLINYGRGMSPRAVDASNLRQIGQASLIFAADNHDRLPVATDLADYARQLAIGGGLNDAACWVKVGTKIPGDGKIVQGDYGSPPESRLLKPEFAKIPHLFSVPLGGITANMPATTPIAWTRGLDFENGAWSPDSPYLGESGHVLFLDGTVRFYQSLAANGGELRRFTDGKPTAKLLEALPADVRLSAQSTHLSPEQISSAFNLWLKSTLSTSGTSVRSAIMPAWALWMLCLFPILTLFFHSISAPKPIKIPRLLTICLFAAPALLLALSVVFSV